MKLNGTISVERIHELLSYDPVTGIFIRLVADKSELVGQPAGSIGHHGSRQMWLDGKRYLAHRLAWVMMTGAWPDQLIDHKDGDPSNNSWLNLRLATSSQNGANAKMQTNNTSGFKGVYLIKSTGRWRAIVRENKARKDLGVYATAQEAAEVARAASERIFGEFYRAR